MGSPAQGVVRVSCRACGDVEPGTPAWGDGQSCPGGGRSFLQGLWGRRTGHRAWGDGESCPGGGRSVLQGLWERRTGHTGLGGWGVQPRGWWEFPAGAAGLDNRAKGAVGASCRACGDVEPGTPAWGDGESCPGGGRSFLQGLRGWTTGHTGLGGWGVQPRVALCWCVVCGLWCVVCGGGVLVGLWLVCGVVGPSPLLAEDPVCYSPPLLAEFRCRWWCAVPRQSWLGFRCGQWCVVCGVWCVVSGVRRWCVGGVVAGVWCGWSLATPGGGSCVLLPATPGWVSLPVVVGGPRHSWLRALGAVPRHSWLGSAGGGGVWWGCGWCVVWLVPRHSWRRFLCATPRHSWLGFAAGGGGRSSPLLAEGPGRSSPPLLAGVHWRRWCVVGLWLVCGVVGPSQLLAEVPLCYSPPLLAGFRCWWWCAVPRHSWLGSAGGGGAWCVVCGVWCVVCSGGVLVGFWLVCGVVGPSPLLAEVPVCYSPPLLARFRCRWWWAVLATPG